MTGRAVGESPGAASTRVRRADAADGGLLAELAARTFREAYGGHVPTADLEAYIAERYTPDAWATELARTSSSTFLAERGGRSIGFALLGGAEPAPAGVPGSRPIQLRRIYVVRDAWRSGAGSALLAACLAEATSRGADTVWLTTWSENRRALGFYRRHGFAVTGTHPFRVGSLFFHDPVLARTASVAIGSEAPSGEANWSTDEENGCETHDGAVPATLPVEQPGHRARA